MPISEHKIAVVNSSSFGNYYPDMWERLKLLGNVFEVKTDPEISGRRLAERLDGMRFIIASVTPEYDREFFKIAGENLKMITRHGIGYDNIDMKAASQKDVIVTRVPGKIERWAVAELTIALIMTCLRHTIPASRAVNEGNWEKRGDFVGLELAKRKVGIIGFGNIGSKTAEILKKGFGAEVYIYDPFVCEDYIESIGHKMNNLNNLLRSCDVLSLHASLTEQNHNMLDREEFKIMQKGVVIVNTARGELINEEALVDALEKNKVKAAGLDVTKREPIEQDNPLLGRENVYIVPHIGAYTEYALREMDEKVIADIEAVQKGDIPEEVVNRQIL